MSDEEQYIHGAFYWLRTNEAHNRVWFVAQFRAGDWWMCGTELELSSFTDMPPDLEVRGPITPPEEP